MNSYIEFISYTHAVTPDRVLSVFSLHHSLFRDMVRSYGFQPGYAYTGLHIELG